MEPSVPAPPLPLQWSPQFSIGFNEHVAEDWHGCLGSDYVENLLKTVAEMVAVDFEFHWA